MRLEQQILGVTFRNPVLLASGTCGYGLEVDDFYDIDRLGGFVIKAVTATPRTGNAAPRVVEFDAGMLNSIGLANVGIEAVLADKLPAIARRVRNARVIVNVAGTTPDEYAGIVRALDRDDAFVAFELNVSCPNVKEGGAIFCSREDLLAEVIAAARAETRRPLIAKLAPNVPDIGRMAEVAVDAGADALTLVNTLPGMLFDIDARAPALGAMTGGVSGPALLPVGVHAVWQARRRVDVPIIGVGGIRSGGDAIQYLLAGASLVQVGTAALADPRAPLRVLSELARFGRRHRISSVDELVGAGHDGRTARS